MASVGEGMAWLASREDTSLSKRVPLQFGQSRESTPAFGQCASDLGQTYVPTCELIQLL